MGFDYALVHAYFTIPPALFLTLCAYPIVNRRHVYAVSALILIAFTSTVPWDSYLIRNGIWTYPPGSIIGPRFFDIPVEECFFFVIQTYITSLLYIIANKPLLHPLYLESDRTLNYRIKYFKWVIQGALIASITLGARLVITGGSTTYLGLILVWAAPFALLTFSLGGSFILSLPLTSTLLPIVTPTLYLWHVDERALGAGTWAIANGTKTNTTVWGLGGGHLDAEEALFFLMTNILVVFGLAAFDNALAVIDAFPALFPDEGTGLPSPLTLVRALLVPASRYDMHRIRGIRDAAARLRRKSRSFFLASSAFTGRLRVDLVLLYSFCRMADDLVDEGAPSHLSFKAVDTAEWIHRLEMFLDIAFDPGTSMREKHSFIMAYFPAEAHSALLYLPIEGLSGSEGALRRLVQGFKTDTRFPKLGQKPESGEKSGAVARRFPIKNDRDLSAYARCVASTVGEMCVRLILFHHRWRDTPVHTQSRSSSRLDYIPSDEDHLVDAASRMGVALQLVNIARDIHVDARIGRVYIPTSWLTAKGSSPEDLISSLNQAPHEGSPKGSAKDAGTDVEQLRRRLLDWAFKIYQVARPTMQMLPPGSRGAMVVAVESYMEIGRVLWEDMGRGSVVGDRKTQGKATVSKRRRLWVALKALLSN